MRSIFIYVEMYYELIFEAYKLYCAEAQLA